MPIIQPNNLKANIAKSHSQKAFTLSEVLITLGIIGVVAAITIPNLVANYQKDQTVTQLKKTYSVLSEAFLRSSEENGMPSTWDLGSDYTNTNTIKVIEAYVVPYLSIMQNCGYSTTGSCIRGTKYYLNGTSFSFGSYQIMLKDGSMWSLQLNGGTLNPTLIDVTVDLNGNKKPNTLGKDLFSLRFEKNQNKIFFIGEGLSRTIMLEGVDSKYGCNKTTTAAAGLYCGALIMKDGWKISDDYPW